MKYLKTYEQITQGDEISILMTKSERYFVKYSKAVDYPNLDIMISLYLLDPIDDLKQSHMNNVDKSRLEEINHSDITIACIKKNSQEYDGYVMMNDETKDKLSENLGIDINILEDFNLRDELVTMMEAMNQDSQLRAICNDVDFQISEKLNDHYDLKLVKFFVGFQQIEGDDDYINL